MHEFIKKEAQEKAREIRLKANEEYEIEKMELLRAETAMIDSKHEIFMKKNIFAQQIEKSKIASKTRLKILTEKEKVLINLFDESYNSLKNVSSNKVEYKSILMSLIEEGVAMMNETKINLIFRKSDLDLAYEIVSEIEKKKESFSFTIDKETYLDSSSLGGVLIQSQSKKIEINNTLDERLNLSFKISLPYLKSELFNFEMKTDKSLKV